MLFPCKQWKITWIYDVKCVIQTLITLYKSCVAKVIKMLGQRPRFIKPGVYIHIVGYYAAISSIFLWKTNLFGFLNHFYLIINTLYLTRLYTKLKYGVKNVFQCFFIISILEHFIFFNRIVNSAFQYLLLFFECRYFIVSII